MIKANLISITAVHVCDSFHMQFLPMISPDTGLYRRVLHQPLAERLEARLNFQFSIKSMSAVLHP